MASNFSQSEEFFVKDVRALWLDIFEPGEGMDGGPPKYKVSALIEPDSDNYKLAKGKMLEAAKGLWGANAAKMLQAMTANSKAVRDGNDKMDDAGNTRPEYADKFFISASNKAKPQVIAQKKFNGEYVSIGQDGRAYVKGQDVTDKIGYEITVPYRGCRLNLKLQMVAGKQFSDKNKKTIPNQVFCRILAVQFVRDDEAFGPGQTSAEGFEDEEVEETNTGRKGGGGFDDMDDDIAF